MTVQPGVRGTFRPPQFYVNTHDHEIREPCEKKEPKYPDQNFFCHSLTLYLLRESSHLWLAGRKMKSENSWETGCQESEMDRVKKMCRLTAPIAG